MGDEKEFVLREIIVFQYMSKMKESTARVNELLSHASTIRETIGRTNATLAK